MKKSIPILAAVAVIVLLPVPAIATQEGLVAWWRFDTEGNIATDSVSGDSDRIRGNFEYVQGVSGTCLKFDENTTAIVRKGRDVPHLAGSFTIEAWIAPQVFPWNWCPIVMQRDEDKGFYFGIDADGRLGLHVGINGRWYECKSRSALAEYDKYAQWGTTKSGWRKYFRGEGGTIKIDRKATAFLPVLKWSHILGTFDPEKGVTIYLNGDRAGHLETNGSFEQPDNSDLRIARDIKKLKPAYTERAYGTHAFNYSFDGLIDEIRIYDFALNDRQVMKAYKRIQPIQLQPLKFRRIPTGPKDQSKFGATYTLLNYDEDYDRSFRMGAFADVVVTFDTHPFTLTYWHGINYYPIWWSENDIGIMHEAAEVHGPKGCQEAMMDRQCRYSHVRIVENNQARIIIHWRNALNNIDYELIHEDEMTGWGSWSDDYYTIYPDGVTARKIVLYSSRLDEWHSFEQDNFVLQPGLWPDDILHKEAGILANLKGEESCLSWESGFPEGEQVEDPVILVYNIKAQYKPYMITQPGVGRPTVEGAEIPWPWCYHWWNHWPAAQIPCDGRQVLVVDGRPSSSCIGEAAFKGCYKQDHHSMSQVMLFGMTKDKRPAGLVPLALSWAQAPEIIPDNSIIDRGYSLEQRCYTFERRFQDDGRAICIKVKASVERPLLNPCFVVKKWGNRNVRLTIDNKEFKRGTNFRYDHTNTLTSTDLIIWMKTESAKPIKITLQPVVK
ncbi:MAG TPA: LamG domain-containing protein [Planctomycetes bacterium]|nr:LamG domain-containing protein [Planctomycetota bacterium]